MSKLVLETDKLTTASDNLQQLSSQIADTINSVSSYDVSCEDGFEFASAKSAIIHNLEACSSKIKNSVTYLSNVVSAHSELQNGFKFNPDSGSKNGVSSNTNTSKDNSSNRPGSSTSRSSTGNSYNSGSSSSSGSSYATASTSVVAGTISSAGTSSSTGTTSSTVQKRVDTNTKNEKTTEVKPKFNKVGYATYNSNNLTDETKKVTGHEMFSYDEDGYAKLDGKYVITCDSSIGKVGDVLRFTLKNGETVECVIGVATVGSEYKDTINFMIDEKKANGFKPKDFSKNIIENTEKVENIGSCIASTNDPRAGETSSEMVRGAIDWALGIADDDNHGYSQATRYGNPNYDCSSLVISAWDAAGVPVKDAGATYTGDMREAFLSTGQFEWIPGDPDVNSLQPGDVLLSESSHTEMYIGNGKNVGAHYDADGMNGDSSGSEISVGNYYSHPWDGVLRYIGSK